MKKLLIGIATAFAVLGFQVPAQALTISPSVGLTDTRFHFGGLGSSATFGGDDKLEITLATESFFDLHVQDTDVVGDEFALVVNGSTVPWDTIQRGDEAANGGATLGASGPYFEAIARLSLGAGLHTLDLTVTRAAAVSGRGWLNVSAATPVPLTAIPLPAGAVLYGSALALVGIVGWRRRRRALPA